MTSVIGLALIAIAQDALAEAEAFAQEARDFADTVGGAFLRNLALGCAIRVALAQGNQAAALHAVDQITPDLASGSNLGFEIPRLSQAFALITSGSAVRLTQAEVILNAHLAEAEHLQHVRLLINTLAVLALLRSAQGRPDAAYAALERAVVLADPGGFVRSFVDLGPAMQHLLRALMLRSAMPAYTERLLAAFTPLVAPQAPQLPALGIQPRFAEMLTRREIEILGFLAQRWSDKEIAAHLVITPNTVRKHTSTIYNKLGVSGRREAVAMASTLGLLPTVHLVS